MTERRKSSPSSTSQQVITRVALTEVVEVCATDLGVVGFGIDAGLHR